MKSFEVIVTEVKKKCSNFGGNVRLFGGSQSLAAYNASNDQTHKMVVSDGTNDIRSGGAILYSNVT